MVSSGQWCDLDRGRKRRKGRGRTEGVAIALHDQGRDAAVLEFGYPGRFRAPGWMQRKRERQARERTGRCRRTAGNPGPGTAPPDDERPALLHVRHHVQPALVQNVRAGGNLASGDPVGLLDPDDSDPDLRQISG